MGWEETKEIKSGSAKDREMNKGNRKQESKSKR
jgi:hypothetical protein